MTSHPNVSEGFLAAALLFCAIALGAGVINVIAGVLGYPQVFGP